MGLSAALALYTLVPQVGSAGRLATRRFAAAHPLLAAPLHLLGLDAILQTRWFLALVLACGVTLALVLEDQWTRALRLYRQPLTPLSFRSAPHRTVFVRGVKPEAARARADLRTRGRLALFGTPLFHLGLMLVLLAGLARSAFGREGVVDLIEGETLAARPGVWGREWGGALSTGLTLPADVRFERLDLEPSRSGAVARLGADLATSERGEPRSLRIGLNAPAKLGAIQLSLSELFGPAVLLESRGDGGAGASWTVLRPVGGAQPAFEGEGEYPGGLSVRLRALATPDGRLPQTMELRVLRGNGLAFVGPVHPGEAIEVVPGRRLVVAEVRYWVELRAARDHALWLAYLGGLLLVGGACMMFGLNKIDTAVITSPVEGGEQVEVALRTLRFAELYAGELEALVARERGR